MSKPILILATLALATACGCTRKQAGPAPVPLESYQQDLVFHSAAMNRDYQYSIRLPHSYEEDTDRRYPVVYMLHGLGDDHNSWNGNWLHANSKIDALEQAGRISEMIYVFPEGLTSYYCNYYNGKYNYMDMIVYDLLPYIDSVYRTVPDKEHRSITGYSMGGFGAMVLAEKHPELFACSAPLSMSFRTDEQYMSESQSGWDGQWGKIFGGIGKEGEERLTDYYKQHCPFYQFTSENAASLSTVKWFFTCGDDEEQLLVANDALHAQLRDIAFPHEYRVENGAHTSSYWMDALSEVLPWFDCNMNGGAAWPECSAVSFSIPEASFNADGSLPSIAYPQDPSGVAVFFFHNGLDEAHLKDCMAMFSSTNTKAKYIFLPCDLSKKDIREWMSFWGSTYMFDTCRAVAFEGCGEAVWESAESFASLVMIDTKFDSGAKADAGKSYYFACTDESDCYRDMNSLYTDCKRTGAAFEYRVINASDDRCADRLRCIQRLKSKITY
ncbi:MAG: alpha/beta hydrolase [Candidatus Cryptobacteroides sp.]